MRKHNLRFTVLLSLLMVLFLWSSTSLAAEERTPIKEIDLTIDSTIEPGTSHGTVTASSGNEQAYRVGYVEILNDNDVWTGGIQPRAAITLYAKSGYYFYTTSKSAFHFSGEDVYFVTAKRDSDRSELTVTVRLDKLENGDLSVSGLEWDESSATALWDENFSAKYYQVRLYREGSSVTSTRTAHETYYDFAGDINRRGYYHFEVRAIGSGSEKGDWESSDSWFVSSYEADDFNYNYTPSGGGPGVSSGTHHTSGSSGGPGATGSSGSGSGGHWCLDQYGWWYSNTDNTYPRNTWQVIDEKYYFFNESGYMRTGWIYWNNLWYYCGPDGALLANTRTPDGYYVGGDGIWIP